MLVTIELTKHYGNNVRGEIASFSPAAASHILAHNGGRELAKFDETTHRFDVVSKKAVELAHRAK